MSLHINFVYSVDTVTTNVEFLMTRSTHAFLICDDLLDICWWLPSFSVIIWLIYFSLLWFFGRWVINNIIGRILIPYSIYFHLGPKPREVLLCAYIFVSLGSRSGPNLPFKPLGIEPGPLIFATFRVLDIEFY